MTKFTHQYKSPFPTSYSDGPLIEVTIGSDASLEDMVEGFKSFLVACGYHYESVNKYFEVEE